MKEQRGRKPRGTPTEVRLKIPDGDRNLICIGDTIYNPDTNERGVVTSLTKIKLDRGDYKLLENDIYVIEKRVIKNSNDNKVIKKSEVNIALFKKEVPSGPIFTGLVDLCGKKIYAGDVVFLPTDKSAGWVNRYGVLIDTKGLSVSLKNKQFISIEDISPEFLCSLLVFKGVIV